MLNEIWSALKGIFLSIANEPSILWYIAPIGVLWFILEIYFGIYEKEKLGWNTALGNGITLMWICVEGLRFLFLHKPEPFIARFFILCAILAYAILIIFLSFSHKLSSKLTYLLASPTPIFYLCFITTLWSHGLVAINKWTVLAMAFLFVFLVLFSLLLKAILPERKGIAELPEISEEEFKPEKKL